MKTRIHAIAGGIGFLMILAFWSSTILSEVFGSDDTIASVKGMILRGMFILIPAMVIVGASGAALGKGRRDERVSQKTKRMPFLAANGLLVLVPMAFFLDAKANAGQFDTAFYVVQGFELAAGAVNLTLMGLNMRDGFLLSGRMQPKRRAALITRNTLAKDTMAFHMHKPAGFTYRPGQWVRVTLPASAESRVLSLVSAPHDPHLTVATRIGHSAYKQSLRTLQTGAGLRVSDPNGSFILHDYVDIPAVFIAGGIGITPFMSMIRHATHKRSAQKITLFYSNRDPHHAAFLDDLQTLAAINPNFKLVATMTALEQGTAWDGETVPIDQQMLTRHLTDIAAPIYYCVGPQGMVKAMTAMLERAGIPKDRMVLETFTGY